jgi:SagB-type dehydrogenase family enzyme
MPAREVGSFEHVPLNTLEDAGNPVRAVTRYCISEVAQLSVGIRSIAATGLVRRWAANSGNFGSQELILLVNHSPDIPSGLYLYRPLVHALAALDFKWPGFTCEQLIQKIIGSGSVPDVLVIVVGALYRLAGKYGALSYRLLNLDAGVALNQMHLVARSLGLECQTLAPWADDVIHRECRLQGFIEHCTAVAALSRRTSLFQNQSRAFIHASSACMCSRSDDPYQRYRELPTMQLSYEVFEESRTKLGAFNSPTYASTELGYDRLQPLGANRTAIRSFLRRRSTIREYSSTPIGKTAIMSILRYASLGAC